MPSYTNPFSGKYSKDYFYPTGIIKIVIRENNEKYLHTSYSLLVKFRYDSIIDSYCNYK